MLFDTVLRVDLESLIGKIDSDLPIFKVTDKVNRYTGFELADKVPWQVATWFFIGKAAFGQVVIALRIYA